MYLFFFFNDTATTEIYTLSLHDALPISRSEVRRRAREDAEGSADAVRTRCGPPAGHLIESDQRRDFTSTSDTSETETDRKSTRLNSSHSQISYAVFCL